VGPSYPAGQLGDVLTGYVKASVGALAAGTRALLGSPAITGENGSVEGIVGALAEATGAVTASAAMNAATAGRRLLSNMMRLLSPGGRGHHPWIVDRARSPPVCPGMLSPMVLATDWPVEQSCLSR
jgi:hypothetical protein